MSGPNGLSRKKLERLFEYLRTLKRLGAGSAMVTSAELAKATGLSPPLVRKDLSSLGRFGGPKGYEPRTMASHLEAVLACELPLKVGIAGVDRTAFPLLSRNLPRDLFTIAALFSLVESQVGSRLGDLTVMAISEIPSAFSNGELDLLVVDLPPSACYEACRGLCTAGRSTVLCFEPWEGGQSGKLGRRCEPGAFYDPAIELLSLSYYL